MTAQEAARVLRENATHGQAMLNDVKSVGPSHPLYDTDWIADCERSHASMLTGADAMEREAAGGWRKIETAPKSSKARLVYCPENRCIFTVAFSEWHNGWTIFGSGVLLTYTPTHWQPLPAPPSEAITTTEGDDH